MFEICETNPDSNSFSTTKKKIFWLYSSATEKYRIRKENIVLEEEKEKIKYVLQSKRLHTCDFVCLLLSKLLLVLMLSHKNRK